MKKSLFIFVFAMSPLLSSTVMAEADNSPTKKNVPRKAVSSQEKIALIKEDDEDNQVLDVTGSIVTEYSCDHGNKITFYQNPGDEIFIALLWNKQILRMRRVVTTTGAVRFESKRHGLVWIGIPAKSLLLDSKKGQQLANECKNSQQMSGQS